MKKSLHLAVVTALALLITATLAYGAIRPRATLTRMRIVNNPLVLSQNKVLKFRYYTRSKAYVGIKIMKNRRTIKTIRASRLQKRGRHVISWNGRDGKRRVVAKGSYTLKIAVRRPGSKRKEVKNKPIYVVNKLLFSEYFDRPNGIIDDNYGKTDALGKWEVTSYTLHAKNYHGYTNNAIFRVRTIKNDFTNFALNAHLLKKDRGINAWEGLSLFVRYNDPNNLYVVSLRNDNKIHIKKKVNGIYTTLAVTPLNTNKLNYWYKMRVIVSGTNIQTFVDGIKYLEINDSSFSSGKIGIRTDNVEAYFDNFEVFAL